MGSQAKQNATDNECQLELLFSLISGADLLMNMLLLEGTELGVFVLCKIMWLRRLLLAHREMKKLSLNHLALFTPKIPAVAGKLYTTPSTNVAFPMTFHSKLTQSPLYVSVPLCAGDFPSTLHDEDRVFVHSGTKANGTFQLKCQPVKADPVLLTGRFVTVLGGPACDTVMDCGIEGQDVGQSRVSRNQCRAAVMNEERVPCWRDTIVEEQNILEIRPYSAQNTTTLDEGTLYES
ncbi:unnamed protein product [Leuciscus chuanchicus]